MKLSLILIFIVIGVSPLIGQTLSQKYIEVSGFSEKEITADYLEISIIVKENDNIKKDNDFAIREKNVLDALKKLGVNEADIRLENFNVYRFGWSNSSNRYTLSKSYIVKVRNMDSINEFTIRLFEAGANDLEIVRRVKTDLEKYKAEAVKEAVENARARATLIATTLNVSIGLPLFVSELNGYERESNSPQDRFYAYQKLQSAGAVHRGVSDSAPIPSDSNIDLRKMKVSYRVVIQFEIVK